MYGIANPWIISLLLHVLFLGTLILTASQSEIYVLSGFWGLVPLPLLAFVVSMVSLGFLHQLKIVPLPRWQKLLIRLLHWPGLLLMQFFYVAFFTLILFGMISPSNYANYPSPSGQRSVTIVASHNVVCTQHVYFNRGLVMQSVGFFQIGTPKNCPKNEKAEIWWQPGETAIAWRYSDRQGVIQLPKD